MAIDEFKYPSEWTESFESYKKHKDKVVAKVIDYMENYKKHLPGLNKQVDKLNGEYFSCEELLNVLH
jgi:hypothetical protein